MKTGGTKQVVTICIGLSILLVLIASFNFINMTVAQSTKRAKEVGVRKALGASKTQLVNQFLSESVLVAVLSMVLACVLVELVMPSFNNLVDRELVLNYASSFGAGIVVVAIVVVVVVGVVCDWLLLFVVFSCCLLSVNSTGYAPGPTSP